MTPEERAKDIIRSCEISGLNYDFIREHIAQAVVQERDALRAAYDALGKLHGASLTSASIAWPAMQAIQHVLECKSQEEKDRADWDEVKPGQ